jgi:hypothetical protein
MEARSQSAAHPNEMNFIFNLNAFSWEDDAANGYPARKYVYFFPTDLFRAAHRAFISCESLFLPAAVIPPFLFAVEVRPVLLSFRAHRTLIAAAILARA